MARDEQALYAGGMRLTVPDEWEDRSIHTFVAPERPAVRLPTLARVQGFRPNVVVTRDSRGTHATVESYAAEQLSAARAQLPKLEVLEDRPVPVDSASGWLRLFTFVAPPQGALVQQLQVFVLSGEWAYTLTFSSIPASFAEVRPLFEQIIASVRLPG